MKRVFFDAAERAITFRLGPIVSLPSIVPAIHVPPIPLFSAHSVVLSDSGETKIIFAPATEGIRYVLRSLIPKKLETGRIAYMFAAVSGLGVKHTQTIPGRYKLVDGGVMRIEPDSCVSLALRRVSETNRSGRTYRLSIEWTLFNMLILLEPVAAGRTLSEAAVLESLSGRFAAGMKSLGK